MEYEEAVEKFLCFVHLFNWSVPMREVAYNIIELTPS
jgi:hypothetical protein